MALQGTDVSKFQGVIDWNKVRNATHLDWVALRASEGTGYTDEQFHANRAGVSWVPRRGFYHFLDAPSTVERLVPALCRRNGVAQARKLIAVVGKLQPGDHLIIDAEGDGVTEDQVVAFAETCEAYYGRPCVAVYTGVYVAHGTIWRSSKVFNGNRPRILAGYISEAMARKLAAPWWCAVWQWTDRGTVPGINGNLDLDRVDDPKAIDAICGLVTLPPFDPAAGKFGLWPLKADKPTISKGATGDAVKYLQGAMRKLGQDVPVTGVFDARTVQGVIDRQKAHGMPPSGIVGGPFWAQLDGQLLATVGA